MLHIAQHYAQPLTLDEGARVCGLSLFAFCRRFNAENGIGFKACLLNTRLQHAEELLAQTRLSITDIAHATGFGSHAHFTRTFRERRGITPTAWRTRYWTEENGMAATSHSERDFASGGDDGSNPPPSTP